MLSDYFETFSALRAGNISGSIENHIPVIPVAGRRSRRYRPAISQVAGSGKAGKGNTSKPSK
jgi:hypothetical protein